MENKFYNLNILGFFSTAVNMSMGIPKYKISYNLTNSSMPLIVTESPSNTDGIFGLKGKCQYDMYFYIDTSNHLRYVDVDGKDYLFEEVENPIYTCKELSLSALKGEDIKIIINDSEHVFKINNNRYLLEEISSGANKVKIEYYETGGIKRIVKQNKIKETTIDLEELTISLNEEETALCIYYKKKGVLLSTTEVGGYANGVSSIKQYTESGGKNVFEYSIVRYPTWLLFKDEKNDGIQESLFLDSASNIIEHRDAFNKPTTFTRTISLSTATKYDGKTIYYYFGDNNKLVYIKNEYDEIQTSAHTQNNRIQSTCTFSLKHLNHLGELRVVEDKWTNVTGRSYETNLTCPFTGEVIEGRRLLFFENEDNSYEYREELSYPGKREEVNSLLLFLKGNGDFETCSSMKLRIDYFDSDDNLLESSEEMYVDDFGEDKFYYFSSYSHYDYFYYEVVLKALDGASDALIILYHFNGGIGATNRYDKDGKIFEVIDGKSIKKLHQSIFGKGVYTGAIGVFNFEDFSQYETADCLGNVNIFAKDYVEEDNSIQLIESRGSLYDNKILNFVETKYEVNTLDPIEIKDCVEGTSSRIVYDEKKREEERTFYENETLKATVLSEYNDKNAFNPDSLKSQEVLIGANSVGKNTIDISDNENDTFLLTTIKNDDTVTLKTKADRYGRISEVSINNYVVDDVEYSSDFPNKPKRINNEYFIYDSKGRLIKKARYSENNIVERIDYNEEGQISKVAKIETDDDGEEYEITSKNYTYSDGIIRKEANYDSEGEVECSVTYSKDLHYNIKGQEVECNGNKGYIEYSSQVCEIADNNELYSYISTNDYYTYTCLFEKKMVYDYEEDDDNQEIPKRDFSLCNESLSHTIEGYGTINQTQKIDGFSCVDVSSSPFGYTNIPVYDMFFYLYSNSNTNDLRIFRMEYMTVNLAIVNNTLYFNFASFVTLQSNTWYLIRLELAETNYNIYVNEELVGTCPISLFNGGIDTIDFGREDSNFNLLESDEKNQGVYITCLTVGNELKKEFIQEVQNKFNNLIRIRKGNNTLDYSNLKTSEYIKTQTHIELNDTYEDYISLHNDTVSKNDVNTINSLPFDKNSNDKNFVYDEGRRSFVLTKDLSYILPITNTGTISLNAKRKNVTTTKDTILSLSGKIELKCDNTKLYLSSSDSNANATYELSNTWNNIILSYSKLVASSSIDTYPYSVKVYVDGALLINTTLQLKYDITSNITMRLSSAFNYEGIKYSESILDDDCNSRYDVISKYNTSGSAFSKIINADYQIRLTSDYIYDDKNRLIQEQTFIGNNVINIYYEYDENNRLKTIARTENNVVQDRLEVIYDALGRLFRTTQNGTVYTYIYDRKGNLTLKYNQCSFEYDSYNRLVRYGGTNVITYDSNDILYPVSIGNKSLIWTNKKLYKFIDGDNVETTFSYNEDGQRIIKTSNGTRYDYNYDINGRLISERRTINNVVTTYLYYYDESDRLIGYSRNNEMFFYLRDAQGVIYAIINSVGNIVARYTYDAYGKVLTSTGTEANNNFIRYKGYYYDDETQLYWVSSRYYSPELCRWISPDSIEYLDPQSINGLNLYAYCGNDPINRFDPTGHSWESFWNGVGDWFSDHWKEVVIGTAFIVGGALVTALTAGAGVGFMAAFGSALLSSTIQVGISVGTSVLVGGLVSVANGGGFFDNVGDNIASAYMWGGIFSGGAQILGGGFRIAANKGVTTGRAGGIKLGNSGVKILSPDKNNWAKAGGTLIKFGNGFRIDTGAMWGLHMHILSSGHLPIGAVIAGFIGTEY